MSETQAPYATEPPTPHTASLPGDPRSFEGAHSRLLAHLSAAIVEIEALGEPLPAALADTPDGAVVKAANDQQHLILALHHLTGALAVYGAWANGAHAAALRAGITDLYRAWFNGRAPFLMAELPRLANTLGHLRRATAKNQAAREMRDPAAPLPGAAVWRETMLGLLDAEVTALEAHLGGGGGT